MTADKAHAQRDPGVTGLQAFFAAIGTWNNFADLVRVGTGFIHMSNQMLRTLII